MSELAFNLNGDPFDPPGGAVGWRVRRIKGQGAPSVVYAERDGQLCRKGHPLIVPLEADIDDLSDAGCAEGKYRLDAVDDSRSVIDEKRPGYVWVPRRPPAEVAPVVRAGETDHVAIAAMRMNTELARAYVDQFPLMVNAMTAMMQVHAGLPVPIAPVAPRQNDDGDGDNGDDDDDEDDDDAVIASKPSGLQAFLEQITPLMPFIMGALSHLKIPGGVGAMFDRRKGSAKARSETAASEPHTTSTPGVEPAPGPRDPAPAAGGRGPTPPGPRRPASRASVPSVPSPVATVPRDVAAPAVDARTTPGAPARASRNSATAEVEASAALGHVEPAPHEPAADEVTLTAGSLQASTATPPGDLPTLDAAAMAHFVAIHGALSLREAMMARALAAELTPAELRGWIAELRQLSVADGVARIRALLGDEASEDTEGGAS